MIVLSVKNLSHKNILQDVSFELKKGSVLTVIGVSGGGKSTLLNIISQAYTEKKYPQNITITPSNTFTIVRQTNKPNTLIPITVGDFVRLYSDIFDRKPSPHNNFARQVFQTFELDILINRRVDKLSGGELKKLLFFICVVISPDVFLLDEIDSNLDLKSRNILYSFINTLKTEFNKSFIITSHDLLVVSKSSDEIIHLEKTIKCRDNKLNDFENINNIIDSLGNLSIYRHHNKLD